jgi:hypothetical protein
MHSREVAVKADAEHQANVVLQDQLQKMRSDLQKQITDRDAQYKKDTTDLQHRFDAASKDRAKMAALLSQLAKLPVPVQVTTPPPTKENPKPEPVAVIPKEDFEPIAEYQKECEQCKLDRGKFEYDTAQAQKELTIADQQIEALKKENTAVRKAAKGTFFSTVRKGAKVIAITAVAVVVVLAGTGHIK